MKKILSLALATLALAGCGTQANVSGTSHGSARLMMAATEARSVQYVAGDIQAARVTVLGSVNGGAYTEILHSDFTGSTLASHLSNNTFSFTVDNLKVSDTVTTYSYQAEIDTYLEGAMTTLLGSSLSSGFTVTASQTPTTITMPTLKLLATPVGSGSAGVTIVDTPAPAVVIR
ncbi:MAG TPA: lipoprotein [Stenomitos sp.]